MIRFSIGIILNLFILSSCFSQSIGDWRMHINYRNSNSAAISPDKIISANDRSVLSYDYNEGSIQILDKATGLSDFGVSAVAYDETSNTFVIAYINSNVDLIKGNTIINLPDIKNKLAAGSKTINQIHTFEGIAYLSTDFGVVALDLENEEVDNTYVIGSTGNQTQVLDCAISQDTIYALTQEGLKKAYLQANNLLDYTQWDHTFTAPIAITEIAVFKDTLYALANGLFQYDGSWNQILDDGSSTFKELTASDILTFVSDNIHVLEYLGNTVDTIETSFLIDPNFSLSYNGTKYFGDNKFGLFQESRAIGPATSPNSNRGFDAVSFSNKIAISSGGFNSNVDGRQNVEGGFYVFEDNRWINHNIYTSIPNGIRTEDLNRMVYNENDGRLYIAGFRGLLQFGFDDAVLYDETNSPLDLAIASGGVLKVTGVDTDSDGNVWVLNPQTTAGLLVKTTDNNWLEFVLGNDNTKLNNLFIDSYDQKWITLRNQGVTIYKEGENLSATGAQILNLTTNSNQGNLPNNNVNCITEDLEGQIWLGTDEGIAVFSCPRDILEAGNNCRISDRITNTLDQFTEYLFETDVVSCIEVDGANRKWIGTSAGVWLLSEDGKTEIHNFNVDNSPLPSNVILDICVHKTTGEVFIITDQGIVSYFSDATEGAETFDDIKAFPNPVRPNYTGFISITGLVQDAYVKITDTHGVLIDEGFALGGKYVWDGNDYNGRRANTGVYYVFSANPDATEKVVTKIAFVK